MITINNLDRLEAMTANPRLAKLESFTLDRGDVVALIAVARAAQKMVDAIYAQSPEQERTLERLGALAPPMINLKACLALLAPKP